MKGSFVRKAASVAAGIAVVGGAVAMAAPAQAGVELCTGYTYANCKDFGVGYVTYVGSTWNDEASSLRVSSPATYTIVYQHADYAGYYKQFNYGTPDLRGFMMNSTHNWDDEISSLK